MKKNVASQVVGAQMVSATDGSAFTSAVTVSVTGDGGTQATGSVGSGACAHEGNGYHTYVPAQAETNYDHVAFTFTGTGAVPQTVQYWPTFPQTGDSFARIGAAGAGLTDLATQASVDTIDDFLDTEIAAILAAVDTEVAAIVATLASGVALTAAERNSTADALLARNVAGGSSAGRTVKQALYRLRNRIAVSGGTATVYEVDDSTPSWDAAVTTAAGNPVSEVDPS